MDTLLGAVFYYKDGCSRWVPACLPDPPPQGIALQGDDLTSGSHRFRLQAVHEDVREAWYTEVTVPRWCRKAG